MIDNSFARFLRLLLLVLVPLFVVMGLRELSQMREENERLDQIQDVLLHNGEVEIGRTSDGKATASSSALQLRASDLKRIPDSLLAVNQQKLKIKNSRLMAAASASTATMVDVETPILNSFITTPSAPLPLADSTIDVRVSPLSHGDLSVQRVSWSDPWIRIHGTIERDTFKAHIEVRDTLQMIVHRVPRRFLFFRWGTKAVRMEVVSQNPHTQLQYPRLIMVRK